MAGDHHVRFTVFGILADDGTLAAIVAGDRPNWYSWNPSAVTNDAGSVEFYAVVTPPWED